MLKKKSYAGMFIATSFIIVPSTIENHEIMKKQLKYAATCLSLAGINVKPKSQTRQRT